MPKKILSKGPFYQIRAEGEQAGEAEVLVYGDIGESWYGDSVAAKQFVEALQALDVAKLIVRINSYGGSVSDGIAIYNAIRRHPAASKEVAIDGVAVSIASLIAMAGDTVTMAENALMMIHAPWSAAVGNAKQMREFADVLDTYAQAMATSYARQTGKPVEDMLALLTDGVDHWYTASEAAEAGFVDEVTASLAAAASLKRFTPPASHAAAQILNPAATAATKATQEATMPNPANTPANPAGGGQPVNADEIRAQAIAAEAKRRDDIAAVFKPFAQREGMAELMAACQADTACTVESARTKALAKLGEGAEPVNPQGAGRVEVVEDERDRRIAGMAEALLARANAQGVKVNAESNPYRGHTLLDLARMSLEKNRIDCRGWDKRKIVGAAFKPSAYGLQTTSDFDILLENVMHKVLLGAYTLQPDTWSRFCKIGSVSDFRAHNRYRTGSIGNLDALNEHGEFTRKIIPDGEKASITAGTRGNIIGITREAIINDDLQALTDLAANIGRAAKRTVEAQVYATLALNSGAGPLLSDGKPLFHADHGNITTGAALSAAAIDLDRVAMASQTDVGGNDYLDLRPAVLLVPLSLGSTARVINNAEYDPDTANKLQKPNAVRGLFRDIVDTPRLSGTRRYLFADPNEAPVLEVAFLDGQQEPYIEAKDGWDVDGAELKARLDFGIAGVDYRGAVTNAGA